MYLILKPQGGINDILCTIYRSYIYCKNFNRQLVIHTCNAYENVLFADGIENYFCCNDPIVQLGIKRDSEIAHVLSDLLDLQSDSNPWLSEQTDSNSRKVISSLDRAFTEKVVLYQSFGGGYIGINTLNLFSLADEIREYLRELMTSLPANYNAIHCRNTDYQADLTEIPSLVSSLSQERKPIYFSTDSQETLARVRSEFAHIEFINKCSSFASSNTPIHHSPNARSRQTVLDMLADLCALVLADNFGSTCILNPSDPNITKSGFSILVQKLREHPRQSLLAYFCNSTSLSNSPEVSKNSQLDLSSSSRSSLKKTKTMVRVGIDSQIFSLQNTGGISRYFSSLLCNGSSLNDLSIKPIFERHRNHYLANYGIGTFTQDNLIAEIESDYAVDADPLNDKDVIIHSTYYRGSPNKYRNNILVATLYDMIPECYPEFFPHGNPHANKALWLEKCNAIISISNASANELMTISPKLMEKVTVIHLGFDRDQDLDEKAKIEAKSINWPHYKYYLHIGSRSGYKNALMLLKAYLRSSAPRQGIHLVFAGSEKPSQQELDLISTHKANDFIHFLTPSDVELYILYRHTTGLLAPSLCEGFGLPLIEALHFDVPVICSEIPAHVEVAEKYANFVSPVNSSAWTEAISNSDFLPCPSRFLLSSYDATVKYYSTERMISEHRSFYKTLPKPNGS